MAVLKRLAPPLVAFALFAGLLEFALRLVPEAIPLTVLEQYEPGLRSQIAEARRLTTRKDTVLIPRHDGGPSDLLWIYQPLTDVTWSPDEPGIVKTIRVDGQGFCNAPADAYQAAHFDLIAIGDSLTFCTAVAPQDTWVARVAEQTGRSAYNLALPGRGLYEYLEILAAYGLQKTPRVVVLTVYEGNDFRDAYIFQTARTQGASAQTDVSCPFDASVCGPLTAMRDSALGRRSYAVNLLVGSVLRTGLRMRKHDIDFRYTVTLADGGSLDLNSRNGDRDEVEFARAATAGTIRTDIFDEALTRFAAMAKEQHFLPVVVYLPSAYTAYAAMARFEDAGIQKDVNAYSAKMREYFAGKTSALGLSYLDTTAVLSDAAAKATPADTVYFPGNVHLTKGGQQVVANAIATFLKGRL